MRHIFPSSSDIATSARSETYFGDIKQNVLEKQKPKLTVLKRLSMKKIF